MKIGKKGFTLVEIIVSLAIMTIVAGAIGAFVVSGNNSYLRGNKELTLQEEAQLTANQMIDLIIDVEKGISFSNAADQTAYDMDGNVAKDVDGNEVNTAQVSELRLINNDNSYMIRWQGSAGTEYADANEVYLYEVANSTDADGKLVVGDFDTAKPALMAEHVSSFSVDLTELEKRKVVLNMTFTYQDKSYDISETIKLRNDLSAEPSSIYSWISGIRIIPDHADLKQGQAFVFNYEITGDDEAKAQGVTWKVTYADGSACKSTISANGKLSVADDENFGENVLQVTCTSVADPNMAANATVTVKDFISLTITPKSGSIVGLQNGETGEEQYALRDGKRVDFTCTLEGSEAVKAAGVTWKVTYENDTDPASGTHMIDKGTDAQGRINASLVADANEKKGIKVLKVTCTSNADESVSDVAWIDVANIPGKYTVELIARTITTYSFNDGQEKIGYKVNIECLPSWANYEAGYPKIQWEVVGDSTGYTLEQDPSDSYKQNLYCSYHTNTTVTVKATVEIDAGVFVYPTIDISLADLKAGLSSGQPYINSNQFVLYRNGSVECWLENYTPKEGEKITWVIANDVDLGLAKSRELEALEEGVKVGAAGSMSEGEFNDKIRSQRLVGFTTSKVAKDGCATNYDSSRGSLNVYASATTTAKDEHIYVWSKYDLPWNKEYRLNLQALDGNGEVIAQTDLLIPECKILFPGGKRYLTISSGDKIDDSICVCGNHPWKTHWDGVTAWNPEKRKNVDRQGLNDAWIQIEFYGMDMGPDGLCDNGQHKESIGVKLYADKPIQQSTSANQVEKWVRGEPIFAVHTYISGYEKNDRFYLYFYNTQKYDDEEYKLDRQLVIYWNTYYNGKLPE